MKKASVFILGLVCVLLIGFSVFTYSLIKPKGTLNKISGSSTSAQIEPTHIFMCADDGNIGPTATTILSYLCNSLEGERIDIHIVSFDDNHMSKENVHRLEALKKKKDFNLDFTYFDRKRLDIYPQDQWNKAIMVKLYVQEIFPNLDRIVWLDDDVLVLKSLNHVFTEDFGSKCIGAVDVAEEYRKHHERYADRWITAGFGVYNLKEMRKQNAQKLLLDKSTLYKIGDSDKPEFCGGREEYALTLFPKEKVRLYPYTYCVMCSAFGEDSYKDLDIDTVTILHFAGVPKPWKGRSHANVRYQEMYEKYMKLRDELWHSQGL